MNSESDKFYGEIPESWVDPEKVRLAQKALDLLVKICKTERPRLRWLRMTKYDYDINRAIEAVKELTGEKRPCNERGYLKSGDDIWGVVRRGLAHWESESIFICEDCPKFLIVSTLGHEFYHWQHPDNLSEEDADRFAEWFEKVFERNQNRN